MAFLDFAHWLQDTLKEIGYLNKVENPDTLKMIVNRLPYGLKLK